VKSMLDEGSEGNFLLGCIVVKASLKLRVQFCQEKMSASRVIQDSKAGTDYRERRGKIASGSGLDDKMQLGPEVCNTVCIGINCNKLR